MHAMSLQSCLTPCDRMDCSLPGSPIHGILQAKILERSPCPPLGDLPDPGTEPMSLASPALQVGSLPIAPRGKCDTYRAFICLRNETTFGIEATTRVTVWLSL